MTTDPSPKPPLEHSRADHPAPPARRARVLLPAAIVTAVAAVAFGVWHARAGSTKDHVVAIRDVPRMEGERIVFSSAFRERAAIAFARIERRPFEPTVRVVGTVAFNPSFVAAIGNRVRGTVRRTFKIEGDRVKANEPLAEIESAELGEAQASVIQAEAGLQSAEVQARRERELLDKGLTTARESEVAQTELTTRKSAFDAAEQRARAYGGGGGFGVYVLRSPLAGHVVERHLAPGQSVDGATSGYKIADLDHLWIELSVFERDLAMVRKGNTVDVTPLSNPGVTLPGVVAHVGEVIDPVSRSTSVRIAVDHPKVHLRPGQAVEAIITGGTGERDAILVPHEAIVYVDGKPTVFVADDETHVKAVPVRLGASDGKRHEVLEGLEPGKLVATSGVFALKSELFR